MMAVMGYFTELIEEKRRNRRTISSRARSSGALTGSRSRTEDLLSWCLLMFMAGLDTVSIQLSYAFWHLATHPADRRRIVEDPEVIPAAVEEFLRQFAFVAPSRKVMRDTDFHGCPLKQGGTWSSCRCPVRPAIRRSSRMAPGPLRPPDEQPHRVRGRAPPLSRIASRPT